MRQRCQHRKICGITTAEEGHGLRAEEPRRCCFEAAVLLAVAAQKPWSAGTDRSTGFERGDDGFFHVRRARQRQIIVG